MRRRAGLLVPVLLALLCLGCKDVAELRPYRVTTDGGQRIVWAHEYSASTGCASFIEYDFHGHPRTTLFICGVALVEEIHQ
jgi:hypothetical protein